MEEKAKESPALEERLAKVEGILEEVRARLNHLGTEVSDLRREMSTEISGLRREINDLRREIYNNFRWSLGIMISMWVTIILTVIFAR